MKKRNYLIPLMLSLFTIVVIVMGGLWLRQMSLRRINEERKRQLEELTVQVSGTFGNALAFNRACVGTAANLFIGQEYASEEELVKIVGRISQTVLTEEEEEERVFFLLDENGVCYDSDGAQGIWGDFDQVVDTDKYSTFISDSTTYTGTYWAFVYRLDTPVTTLDGRITVRYVVLLKPVAEMARYYASEAYQDVCETYILKENGTRMYDSRTPDDAIPAYNVYKSLQEAESRYGDTFSEVLENLETRGVACGSYEDGETEYCYSLAWQQEFGFVLLFLIPADAVAANTVSMVSVMMWLFIVVGLIMVSLVILSVSMVIQLANNLQIAELKEQNLKETKEANERLASVNESLIKAKRDAESALDIARSANRAKSSFLSNMSHDIRTPLNAIIGFLTLLERDADNPAQVRLYTGKIQVSSQHLLNLINDILDMSRIESGKTTLNIQTFSVGSLLEETRTVIMPQANGKKLNFTMDSADTAGLIIRGDRLRLGQILMNLLSNAVKYTPEGGNIRLTVERTGKTSPKMVTLKFAVADDGIGMSPEFQKRIFEPFEREQNSTTSGIQGTGLGMAITKNLVDLMGGIIFVDSIPGEGSTFTLELTFPLAGEDESADSGSAAGGGEKNKGRANGGSGTGGEAGEDASGQGAADQNILNGRHFLIAEDNDINAEIIRELLAMEGATCEIAANGKIALALFEKSEPGTFDAIFMDIQMPVMGGYEAARLIRACGHPDAAHIPIAAMTANAFAEDVQKALQAGMNTHIPKPVDMEKIREFIAGELGQKK